MTTTSAPTLDGWLVRLRPIVTSDYPAMYRLAVAPGMGVRWRFQGGTPSPSAFEATLWQGVQVQFLVESAADSQFLGYVAAYKPGPRNHFTHISMNLDPAYHRKGWPLEAGELFVDYLFASFPFHKLYAETIGLNLDQFLTVRSAGLFHEEARLPNYAFVAGAYRDLHILALYRDDWFRPEVRAGSPFRRRRARRLEEVQRERGGDSADIAHLGGTTGRPPQERVSAVPREDTRSTL